MAKKNKKVKKSKPEQKMAKDEVAFTWDDVAAMSDSDDETNGNWVLENNTKAKKLKDAIVQNLGGMLDNLKQTDDGDEDEFEEDVLDGSSSEQEEGDDNAEELEDDENPEQAESEVNEDEEASESEDDEDENRDNDKAEENAESFIDKIKNKADVDEEGDSESDNDSDDENEEDEKKTKKSKQLENNNNMNSKALSVVAAELNSVHSKMPWAETFVILPSTPLPFGENGDPESNPLDIHDDLKREVAFYNTALEAVNLARPKFKEAGIPFTRPDDFFAEMVKTDGKTMRGRDQERMVNSLD
jgi:rRNA-processing protein EBP2